ncbi:MAG: hypothetical protein R3245_04810 [Kiloniellales bacterium]|nr:hypothetical protein [Kiloniellales bacterium]
MVNKWILSVALVAVGALGACESTSGQKPEDTATAKCGDKTVTQSGTLEGSGDSVGWIAGVNWGEGTLTLNDGTQHKFHYRGVKGLETGIAHASFKGEVYNLQNIEDFIGVYYGAGKSFNLIVGSGEFAINNSKCVVIKAKSKSEGIQLSAPGPGGIHVQLGE